MRARLLRDGGAGPPLVYVPGIDGTGEMLLGTAAVLETRFRLLRLCYEAETGALPSDPYGRLAASLVEACAGAVAGPVLLLAESFGVGVALRAALDHPARVAGLALVNGFARYPARARLLLARALAALTPPALFGACRRAFAARALFGPARGLRPADQAARGAAIAAFRRRRGTPFDRGYRLRLAMLARLDLEAELPRIRVPVDLYASDKDRIVDSVEAARRMAERLPAARLTILENRGHVVLPLITDPWVQRFEDLARRAGLLPAEAAGTKRRSGAAREAAEPEEREENEHRR